MNIAPVASPAAVAPPADSVSASPAGGFAALLAGQGASTAADPVAAALPAPGIATAADQLRQMEPAPRAALLLATAAPGGTPVADTPSPDKPADATATATPGAEPPMDTPAAPPDNPLPSGDTPSAGTPIADAPPPPVPATPVTGTIASADPAKPATPEMAQAVVASAIVRPGRDHRGLRAALAAPAGDAPATDQSVAPPAHRTDHAAITAAPLATPASAATPQPQIVTVQGEIGPSVQQQPAVHEDAARPAAPAMGTTPSLAVIVDKDVPGPSDHAVADGGIAHGGAIPSDLSAARPTSFGDVVAARAPSATLSAQAGTMGRDMGVEIARHVVAGRSEMLVRLDPPDMGRIDVRLSFDREGGLRAVMSADSHGALDLLRRETGDLSRALGDAGIKTDAQSFRFDSRGSDTGQGGQRGQHHQPGQTARDTGTADDGVPLDQPQYRTMRASGHIDVMA